MCISATPTESTTRDGGDSIHDKVNDDEEDALMRTLETKITADYVLLKDHIRKRPFWETLSRPSSLLRAVVVFPMPWLCLYTVRQLHGANGNATKNSSFRYMVSFFVGYFLADLVSGLAHIRLDTTRLHVRTHLGQETQWRTLMEYAAWGFQRHHVLQHNWQTHDDVLESGILTTGLLASVPFFAAYMGLYLTRCITSPQTAFGWFVMITALMHLQVFHALSHNAWTWTSKTHHRHRPSNLHDILIQLLQVVIQLLRWLHLIMDVSGHHLHHTRFDCNFALINGWSNMLLNPLYVYLETHGFIDPEYHGAVQRRLYIDQKAMHKEPFLTLFPAYRAYQLRRPQSNKK